MLPLLALALAAPPCYAADFGPQLDLRYATFSAGAAHPADVGAIGLRTRDNRLLTLRVDDLDGMAIVSSGVYVPRPEGWWVVNTGTTSDGATAVGWTLAGPIGPVQSVPIADRGCGEPDPTGLYSYQSRSTLLFVSPTLLTTEDKGNADCGGAHGASWDEIETATLSAGTTFTGRAVDEVFGPDVERLWREAGAQALARADQPDCFEAVPTQWALVRSRGHWILRGRFHYGPEVCRGASLDYTVPAPVPEGVTGPDRLPVTWEALTAAHPGLRDAVASPDGRIVLLVDAGGISLVVNGLEVDRMPIAGVSIVAAQWATGAQAAAWVGVGSPLAAGLELE